jgi:hypothetical protein
MVLAACDGENLFTSPSLPGGSGGGLGGGAPSVQIEAPVGDSTSAKPIGDSVLVTARIRDNTGIKTVQFDGFAFRGDESLGTNEVVARYETKVVDLLAPVGDTVLSRFLVATADSTRETAHLIVTATDTLGNAASDTVSILIGGPDVQLLNLEGGETIQSGRTLSLRVMARDPGGVRSVEVILGGVVSQTVSEAINPVVDSVLVDVAVAIPAGAEGDLQVLARARNNLDIIGQAGPFNLRVSTSEAADNTAPSLTFTQESRARLEIQDVLRIDLSGADDNQGSGIATAGYTVVGRSPTRGTTEVVTGQTAFNPPLTGNVAATFEVPVFHVDQLSLPDTIAYEITAWLVDSAGNCAASTGADERESLECGTLATGQTVATDRTGLRIDRVIVDGQTVLLPTGGKIMDAAVDAPRQNLYLSNIERDRVEVFDLETSSFQQAVAVGSEPWGITMDNGGDNLLVANSGGTNISSVDLTPASPEEDVTGRILTPDVVFFDVLLNEDENGADRYIVTFLPQVGGPAFSDRPQYLAVDGNNRILYSTRTTEIGDLGTIRRAIRQQSFLQPEIRVFYEHTEHTENENATAIGNVDAVTATSGGSAVIITDHVLGEPGNTFVSAAADPSSAALNIQGQGSDVVWLPGRLWNLPGIGFRDTTYVAASGDGDWVVFGEGAANPIGRIIMYESAQDALSDAIPVSDILVNAAETVRGVGLNYDGTLGVARGDLAYFFTTDLRLQGTADLPSGGAGAVLHPLHANAVSLANQAGQYRPDTHIAFVGTGEGTVDIIDTFHFFRSGRIFIRGNVVGPLKAVLPFPGDNAGLTCSTIQVTDEDGAAIGTALDMFAGDDFQSPHPAQGGPTEDACIALKLFGVTDTGGVVVINVRKGDILRDHPARQ